MRRKLDGWKSKCLIVMDKITLGKFVFPLFPIYLVDAESDRRRNSLEWRPMRSPPGTCKTKFHPKLMGGGSGRTLRRSSQP